MTGSLLCCLLFASAAQVLGGQVVYEQRQQLAVAHLFDVRAAMHQQVYQDPQAKAAQTMIADAMLLANTQLNIEGRMHE